MFGGVMDCSQTKRSCISRGRTVLSLRKRDIQGIENRLEHISND